MIHHAISSKYLHVYSTFLNIICLSVCVPIQLRIMMLNVCVSMLQSLSTYADLSFMLLFYLLLDLLSVYPLYSVLFFLSCSLALQYVNFFLRFLCLSYMHFLVDGYTYVPFAARKRLHTSPSVLECSSDMQTCSLSSAALVKSGFGNQAYPHPWVMKAGM